MLRISKTPRHLKGYYSRKIKAIYDNHRKLINRGIITVGTILFIMIFAGFIPYSTGMMREKAQRICEKSFGGTCVIKRITLVPWRGFSIDSLVLSRKDIGTEQEALIPHARLSYRIVPLLFRLVDIKTFAIEKPHLRIVLPKSKSVPVVENEGKRPLANDFRKTLLEGFPFSVAFRSVSIDNGDFSVERGGKPLVEAAGVDAAMKFSYDKPLLLDGKIAVRSLRFGGLWDIVRLKAKLAVSDLNVTLSQCRGEFYGGTADASGKTDLSLGTIENFHFELSHVNLKKLYEGSRIGKGECSGELDGKIDMNESPLDPDSLNGIGKVMLSDVEAHDLPLQNSLFVFIAVPKLRDITFSRLGTDLTVKNGRIFTPYIHGEGEPLEVNADGWVGFNGQLSEKCEAVFSPDFSGGLPPVVERSLDKKDDGRRSFKCSVSGTFANPQLQVDKRIVRRVVKNVFHDAAKGWEKLFKK
jgi:hypothetical protein